MRVYYSSSTAKPTVPMLLPPANSTHVLSIAKHTIVLVCESSPPLGLHSRDNDQRDRDLLSPA
jgi:hypothetical protein